MICGYPPLTASPRLLFLLSWIYICCYVGHPSSGISISSHDNIRCTDRERDALLTFKRGIKFDTCELLTSWGRQEGNRDCCKWSGVSCSNSTGYVIKLDLHSRAECNLEGNLSSSLVELKYLRYLDLSNNDFQGLPIPTFLGSLSKLKHLNLSYSQLAGEIPHQLGNLSGLMFLDISYNYQLSANSLHWLSHLTLLKDLNLSNTYLIEATDWFQAIKNLPFLRSLRLDLCLLPSTILPPFSNMNSSTTLAVISLARNYFNDSAIFQWLFNLSGISTHLVQVDLSYNSLSGPIPSAFGKMRTLSYLDLSNNELDGPFPAAIGNIRTLSYLDLSNNLLTGLIPDAIGNLKSLAYLKLSNNQLSSSIPDALRNLRSLEYLDLSYNSVTSTIPVCLGYMLNLTSLDLSHNLLTGVIPSQLDQYGTLGSLDLSFNLLSGPIPSALWKFQAEVFLGNIHLCGEPLLEDCSLVDGGDVPSQQEVNKASNDNFDVGIYVSAGLGFYLGFWVVCGTLVFKHSWRFAYFQLVDKVINKIYVSIAIYVIRFRRNSEMQNV